MTLERKNLLLGGLRLLLGNKRLLLWSYLALLIVGLIGGASLHARISPFLDHSLAAEKLAGSLDMAYYAELFQHANEHDPGNTPVTVALTLLSVVFSYFLAASSIFVFLSAEAPRLATVLRVGAEYLGRFLRLSLLTLLVGGFVLGPLAWVRTLYLTRADEKYVEAAFDLRFVLTLFVLLVGALLLRLWFDLAEVYAVRLGREGNRRVRRTLRPALVLLRAHFSRLVLAYLAAGSLGWLAFAGLFSLWAMGQGSSMVVPVFLWSQVALLCLVASRIWQRGIVTALVLEASEQTQTVILVQPGPPEPYNETLLPFGESPSDSESTPLPAGSTPLGEQE